jgi:hypothetical protein
MGWVINTTSRPLYPRKQTRCRFYRRLGGPQGQSGRAQKISSPEFDPQTIQPARVAVPTELPVSQYNYIKLIKLQYVSTDTVPRQGKFTS